MNTARIRNPWIAGNAIPRPDSVRLLCFAHAGGGSSLFYPWRELLGPHVQVLPVLLPGREARLAEKPFRRMDELIEPLVSALWDLTDGPVSIFGHSLGSVIGYEVSRALASRGRAPKVLFVSGRRAPHLPARLADVHDLDEPTLFAALRRLNGTPEELLADRALIDPFLPTIRADFELNETYRQLPGPVLTCEVIGCAGASDPQVTEPELAAWGEVTIGSFSYHMFDGDHFYLKPVPSRLAELVRKAVLA